MKDFKWKWQDTLIVILGLGTFAYALANYGRLPDQLPVQFGITGGVNRTADKQLVIFLMGALGIFLPVLLQLTRKADPKKENYKKFENAHGMIRLIIGLYLDLALVLSINYGLGKNLHPDKILIGALGVMFIVIGNYMPQIKDNFFLGIKTPWTLAHPEVWRKTHRLSGGLWVISGLLIIAGSLLPGTLSVYILVTAMVLAILGPTAYSWVISREYRA